MKTRRLLLAAILAGLALVLQPGCGGPKPATAPEPDTTSAVAESGDCATCDGSDSVGAVCDAVLDASAAAVPEASAAAEVLSAPAEALPKMWDFGSEKCIPCKTMKEIIDPMAADYQGKVDIRIVNVYEEQELTRQSRISVIPTQVFIDAEGKELFRHIGVYPRDSIEARFREFGMPVVAGAVAPTKASDCLT